MTGRVAERIPGMTPALPPVRTGGPDRVALELGIPRRSVRNHVGSSLTVRTPRRPGLQGSWCGTASARLVSGIALSGSGPVRPGTTCRGTSRPRSDTCGSAPRPRVSRRGSSMCFADLLPFPSAFSSIGRASKTTTPGRGRNRRAGVVWPERSASGF